jgi:hypothetical protein
VADFENKWVPSLSSNFLKCFINHFSCA